MSTETGIAVIILNWNSAERTLDCLKRLAMINTPSVDIFVVDNGSNDGSEMVVAKQYPSVKLVENQRNLGFGGGCNAALQQIIPAHKSGQQEYEFVLLLNTDAGLDEQCLQQLVETLKLNKKIGVAGPVIVDRDNRHQIIAAGGLNPAVHINTYSSSLERWPKTGDVCRVDYVSGTVALLRVDSLLKAGVFDEDYFFSCEMADLCKRIEKEGYQCGVVAKARAWHAMDDAGAKRETLYRYYSLRNRFLYIRKFYTLLLPILFCFWLLVGGYSMLKALIGKNYKGARAIRLALQDGLLGNFGGRNFLFNKTGIS